MSAQDPAALRGINLFLAVDRPGPVYPVGGREDAGYVGFVGETLILRVTLTNDSPEQLRVRDSDGVWTDGLQVAFEADPRGAGTETTYSNVPYTVLALRHPRTRTAVDGSVVAPGEAQEARLQIAARAVDIPGRYTIRVTVRETSVRAVPANAPLRLSAIDTFFLRAVESLFDELNVLYSAGVRARLDGRHEEARAVLLEMLRKHPTSLPAWYELGRSWTQENRCGEATGALRRVLQLADQRADPDEASARRGTREAYVGEVKRLLAKCGA